ncbi:hypothetical protein [Pseudonocardia sp.]|uniref:hypothetical protein n=1 Tax=Pseudonocardia sp. TaxID=60912 RepID=UPI003D0A7EF8
MEMNVLKKASVVVAVTTAGLLAVSPLAFAGSHGKSGDRFSQSNKIDNSKNRSSSGLINVDALNGDILGGGVLNNANVCPNVKVDAIKILGLLGGNGNTEVQGAKCVSANGNTSQENDED